MRGRKEERGRGEGFAWCVARGGDTLLFIIGDSDYPPVRKQFRQTSNRIKQKEAC